MTIYVEDFSPLGVLKIEFNRPLQYFDPDLTEYYDNRLLQDESIAQLGERISDSIRFFVIPTSSEEDSDEGI